VTFTEYPIGSYPANAPRYIKTGPDGNLWFTDGGTEGRIGRISPHGERFTGFGPLDPVELAFGSNGAVFWAGDKSYGERTASGFTYESTSRVLNYAAAVSPSGEFWFSTEDSEWCHPPVFGGGQFCKHFPDASSGRITSIAFDRSGNAWGAFYENNSVRELVEPLVRVDLPTGSGPARIAIGPEGALWVTMSEAGAVDRITPAGERTRFSLSAGSGPNDIALGPDGAFWIAELKANKIARMTTAGVVTGEFPIPTPNTQPIGIAAGPDGAIWFTESLAAKIGRLTIDASTTTPVPGAGTGGTAGRDTTPPSFTKAPALHPARFRDRGRIGGRVPKGSTVAFTLSEAAAVKAQVSATRPGRKVNGNCIAAGRSSKHKPACHRTLTLGALSYTARSGANRFAFSGRVAGHALKPGAYRLSVIATDAAGNGSAPAKLSFTIAP
jgi:streptogramin lyase